MIGRLRPERGAVVFDQRDVTRVATHARCRAGIALTHQIPHPFEALTVFENVLVGGIFGGGRAERSAHAPALAALALTGLADRVNTRAGTLTLLERKRLELARALATGPELLLLDEFMAGLNPAETAEAMALIRRLLDEGLTVLMVEHIVWALMDLSRRLIVLSAGEKIAEGPPALVAADPRVIDVYLGAERPAAGRR